jgi:hypothetical protein
MIHNGNCGGGDCGVDNCRWWCTFHLDNSAPSVAFEDGHIDIGGVTSGGSGALPVGGTRDAVSSATSTPSAQVNCDAGGDKQIVITFSVTFRTSPSTVNTYKKTCTLKCLKCQ